MRVPRMAWATSAPSSGPSLPNASHGVGTGENVLVSCCIWAMTNFIFSYTGKPLDAKAQRRKENLMRLKFHAPQMRRLGGHYRGVCNFKSKLTCLTLGLCAFASGLGQRL